MIFKTMSRQEADKIVAWVQSSLTVTMTSWQKELFTTMMMHPDVPFDVRIPRAGRG